MPQPSTSTELEHEVVCTADIAQKMNDVAAFVKAEFCTGLQARSMPTYNLQNDLVDQLLTYGWPLVYPGSPNKTHLPGVENVLEPNEAVKAMEKLAGFLDRRAATIRAKQLDVLKEVKLSQHLRFASKYTEVILAALPCEEAKGSVEDHDGNDEALLNLMPKGKGRAAAEDAIEDVRMYPAILEPRPEGFTMPFAPLDEVLANNFSEHDPTSGTVSDNASEDRGRKRYRPEHHETEHEEPPYDFLDEDEDDPGDHFLDDDVPDSTAGLHSALGLRRLHGTVWRPTLSPVLEEDETVKEQCLNDVLQDEETSEDDISEPSTELQAVSRSRSFNGPYEVEHTIWRPALSHIPEEDELSTVSSSLASRAEHLADGTADEVNVRRGATPSPEDDDLNEDASAQHNAVDVEHADGTASLDEVNLAIPTVLKGRRLDSRIWFEKDDQFAELIGEARQWLDSDPDYEFTTIHGGQDRDLIAHHFCDATTLGISAVYIIKCEHPLDPTVVSHLDIDILRFIRLVLWDWTNGYLERKAERESLEIVRREIRVRKKELAEWHAFGLGETLAEEAVMEQQRHDVSSDNSEPGPESCKGKSPAAPVSSSVDTSEQQPSHQVQASRSGLQVGTGEDDLTVLLRQSRLAALGVQYTPPVNTRQVPSRAASPSTVEEDKLEKPREEMAVPVALEEDILEQQDSRPPQISRAGCPLGTIEDDFAVLLGSARLAAVGLPFKALVEARCVPSRASCLPMVEDSISSQNENDPLETRVSNLKESVDSWGPCESSPKGARTDDNQHHPLQHLVGLREHSSSSSTQAEIGSASDEGHDDLDEDLKRFVKDDLVSMKDFLKSEPPSSQSHEATSGCLAALNDVINRLRRPARSPRYSPEFFDDEHMAPMAYVPTRTLRSSRGRGRLGDGHEYHHS